MIETIDTILKALPNYITEDTSCVDNFMDILSAISKIVSYC